MDKQSNTVVLFNQNEVRRSWDNEKELWYFSVIDVIAVLTGSSIPKRYWTDLKRKLIGEGSELYEKIVQLKLPASDGKKYATDVADTETMLRLIQSIPSPNAEPFKLWLAQVGYERLEETATTQIFQQSGKSVIAKNKKVLVTGVFDILHDEHRVFLQKAKKLGDYLIVGVESDARVRQIKGAGRPINSQVARVKNLQSLQLADEIFILPEQFSKPEDHKALIQKIKPDYLAVSSHTKHLDKKQAILKECGGEVVVVHEHNPKTSTTQLLQK